MAGSDEQRGSAAGSSAGEPGAISRLLVEIFQIPEGDLASSWREPLKPGDAVGRYEIRREIGRGGFGAVYEAFDPELGRTVALKALKPGRTKHQFSEEWIKKEAEAVAKLDHPAIVTIFDVGTCPAGAYLVMELLRGETLARRIEKGPLPVDEALRIAEQMAEGLAHAHSRGVLHRDLKPANVFVCEDGRVKLLDFGLAHLLGTEGSSGAGTPAYMAPEQAAGTTVDERADVWAAGMVLGEMLTGKRPVERTPSPPPGPAVPEDGTELMWGSPPTDSQLPTVSRSKLGGVPRAIGKAIAASVSDDPEARPRNGAAWLAQLHSARRAIDRPRTIRRVTAFATAFVLVGLAVAGFATWRIWERQIPGGRPTVAVADFANETGDSELDGISGLLTTSLEQGTQLRVLTRSRMLDVLKQLGRQDVQRIDEPLAREVGRQARADVLLLASIRRLGNGLVVEMRALDPLHDEYVFTVSERASTKDAVFQVVDRLADTTRRQLRVAGSGPSPAPPITAITTANPKAWDTYSRALHAWNRTGPQGEAEALARQAVAEDPGFALARLLELLVRWPQWGNNEDGWLSPEDEARAREKLDALEPLAGRLPEKERTILRTLRLGLDGKWEEVRLLRDQLAAAYPLDKEAQYLAGDVRFHSDAEAEAVPWFKRALQLDPGYRIAALHVTGALLATGKASDEIPWLREQAPLAASAPEMVWFARAFLSAGLEEDALALLRQARGGSGSPWPPALLLRWWIYAGRAPEAERAIRELLAACEADPGCAGKERELELRFLLSDCLASQGRYQESRRVRADQYPPALRPYKTVQSRQWHAAGAQDMAALDEATRGLERFSVYLGRDGGNWLEAPKSAAMTSMAGRLDLAAPVARMVLEGGGERGPVSGEWSEMTTIVALASAGPGETPPAVEELARHPQVFVRFFGAVLLGHHLKLRGDCRGAIVAYESAREVPWHPLVGERIYVLPLVLHSLAECHEKLGDLARARERNSEMLALWAKGDPDLPLLIEAKAMRERLAVK